MCTYAATGEFVYFGGSELDSEKTAQFALPPSVIPNVLKITDGSLVLLSKYTHIE